MIKSRKMRLSGMQHEWGENNAYRILVGKREGRRPLGRRRYRWVDYIKTDLRASGLSGMD
jgi:hypothetical protein